jgi:hypothetical protein
MRFIVNTDFRPDCHFEMPKTRSKLKDVHSHLSLKVKSYSARVGALIQQPIYTPTFIDENDPAYSHGTDFEIVAVVHWPEERAEETYWITIYSYELNDRRLRLTLKDFQRADKNGVPQYRQYRGDHYPIFDLPKQIGFLQRNRHYGVWTGAVWVAPNIASDMLTLLLHTDVQYIALHEIKTQRKRGIFGIRLQTNDPAEE